MDVNPEDDDPDELPPLPGRMNREGSQLRNKIKEALFSNYCILNDPNYPKGVPLTITSSKDM